MISIILISVSVDVVLFPQIPTLPHGLSNLNLCWSILVDLDLDSSRSSNIAQVLQNLLCCLFQVSLAILVFHV